MTFCAISRMLTGKLCSKYYRKLKAKFVITQAQSLLSRKRRTKYTKFCIFWLGKNQSPVIQILASSAELAIKSRLFPSPWIIEKEYSSGKWQAMSEVRNNSVLFPDLTSLIWLIRIRAFPESFLEGSQRRQLKYENIIIKHGMLQNKKMDCPLS